jgi:hypothetical protein
MLLEKGVGGEQDAGRAVAALEPVLVLEGLLQWREALVGRDAFHRRDGVAAGLHREHEARAHRLAVQQYGARAAHAVLTAHVGAGEIEHLAEAVGQREAGLHLHRVLAPVHREAHRARHAALRQRPIASVRTRSASTAATSLR